MPVDPEVSPQKYILQLICIRFKGIYLYHVYVYAGIYNRICVLYIPMYISREIFIAALFLIENNGTSFNTHQ